jgi:glutathione-regulated potassium-efflux system ancillary protein KefG
VKVRVEDLIDSNDVAEILGLSSPRAVSVYIARYPDMPRPVVNRGANRAKLWLREDIIGWKKTRAMNRRS